MRRFYRRSNIIHPKSAMETHFVSHIYATQDLPYIVTWAVLSETSLAQVNLKRSNPQFVWSLVNNLSLEKPDTQVLSRTQRASYRRCHWLSSVSFVFLIEYCQGDRCRRSETGTDTPQVSIVCSRELRERKKHSSMEKKSALQNFKINIAFTLLKKKEILRNLRCWLPVYDETQEEKYI